MIIVIKSEGRPFFHLFAPPPPETSEKLLYTYTWGLREKAQMCNINSRLSKQTIQYSHTIDLGYKKREKGVQFKASTLQESMVNNHTWPPLPPAPGHTAAILT